MNNILINSTEATNTYVKELYRILRTNVEFSGANNRVIAITSSTPGDGKSTVSFNLAQVFAEAGKRVLFIDADMRRSTLRSRISRPTGEKNEELVGLSHLLIGKSKIKDAIYTTNILNLYLLPPGVFPSNPAELLSESTFDELIFNLKQRFDYVIIDTPPVGSVTDAAIIIGKSDGSILVVSANNNSRTMERKTVEQIRKANPNILGVVLNRVDTGFDSQYKTKYNYYVADKEANSGARLNNKKKSNAKK